MRFTQTSRVVAGHLALICAALVPTAANAACELQSFEIPVTMKQTRAVAHLTVNGKEAPFTLDSGAFFSMMTEAAAAQFGLRTRSAPESVRVLGIIGPIDYRIARVDRLGLQGAEIPYAVFMVGINEPGAGTMGLLGRNILRMGGIDTEYDIANGIVRLMTPGKDCAASHLAYWAGSSPVVEVPLIDNWRQKLPAIKVHARINGQRVTAEFDTGSVSVLSLKAAKRVGLVEDERQLQSAGPIFGAGRGVRSSWTVQVDRFELGTESVTDSRLLVADMPALDVDMLIGIDFFLSHRIYVAQSQDRVFFTYSGGPVFDLSQKMATPVAADVDDADAPRDAPGLARRGSALAVRGELMLALAHLDRAIELAPTVVAYRVQRAQLRLRQNQSDAALVDLDEALRLDPQAHEARLERARLQLYAAADSARTDLQELDERLAPQVDMRRQMGELYSRLKEPLLALRQYDQWIDAHANEADLYKVLQLRCWVRALANTQLNQAMTDCNKALDVKPDLAVSWQSRGLVHLRLGQWKQAMADYDAALALNPKFEWSLWGRGLARLRSGAREQGLSDIAAAQAVRLTVAADAQRYGLDVPVFEDQRERAPGS